MDNTYLLQTRRTDYLSKLQKITVPLYVEGVYSIYQNVKKNNKARKYLLKEFQQSMVDVSRWSQDIIRNEHQRFKQASTVVDKLIKAIFDLDITLKQNLCANANDFIPQPWDFIHQCYLNVARSLWKQPFLIYDVNVDKLTLQQNKLKIEKLIASSIQDTFTQFIPLDIEHNDVVGDDLVNRKSLDVVHELNAKDADIEKELAEAEAEAEEQYDVVPPPQATSLDICETVGCLGSNADQLRRASISNGNLEGFHQHDNAFHQDEEQDYGEVISYEDVGSDVFNVHHDDVQADEEQAIVEDGDEDREEDERCDQGDDGYDSLDDIDNGNDYAAEEDDDEAGNDAYEREMSDVCDEQEDEVASFHSEDVGDVESVRSEELYIQRHDVEEDTHLHHTHHEHYTPEIKEVFIGTKTEMEAHKREVDMTIDNNQQHQGALQHVNPTDIKVVTIDENRSVAPKNSLLAIKKKVKSSIYNKERFADKVRGERRNMSFF